MANQIIKVPEMATELGTTADALRKKIHRGESGKSIPPITRLGQRSIVFMRSAVEAWYSNLAEQALKDVGIERATADKKPARPNKKAPTPEARNRELSRDWK